MNNKIRLRALTRTDIKKTLKWNNQDDIKHFYAGHPFPVNLEQEEIWYEKILSSNFPITVFGIEKIKENKLIGLTMLKDINLINREAEFAMYIGEIDERGKGLAKEATLLTLRFGFYRLGLNRIFLKVLEENKNAISLYEKCDFKIEGLLRETIFKNNEFRNELIMSVLKSEFTA